MWKIADTAEQRAEKLSNLAMVTQQSADRERNRKQESWFSSLCSKQ